MPVRTKSVQVLGVVIDNLESSRGKVPKHEDHQERGSNEEVEQNKQALDQLVRQMASLLEVELGPLDLRSLIQEVETPKPRGREKKKTCYEEECQWRENSPSSYSDRR